MKTTTQTLCPICNQSAVNQIRYQSDYLNLCECGHCHSWFSDPRPNSVQHIATHDTESYFSENPYFVITRSVDTVTHSRYDRITDFIKSQVNIQSLAGKRALDIGCDIGSFLSHIQQQLSMIPVGVDVSSRATAMVREAGIEVYHCDFSELPATVDPFFLITANSVIEHIMEPRLFMQKIHDRLEVGGIAYLQTPNIESSVYRSVNTLYPYAKKGMKSVMESLFCAEHIQYFTKQSLSDLGKEIGFEVVGVQTATLPIEEWALNSPLLRRLVTILQGWDRLFEKQITIRIVLRKNAVS